MAYMLNLVPPQGEGADRPAAKGALERLRAGLGQNGPVEEGEPGTLSWTQGGTRLDVRVSADREGRLNEIDVVLPYGAIQEEVESAIRHLAEIAEEGSLRVFDPQLGRSVGRGDVGAISARFAEASAYHVAFSGNVEDARQGLSTAAAYEQPPLVPRRAKVFMAAIAVLFVLYLLFRALVINPLTDALAPTPELGPPERGPPSGWLDRHPPSRTP